MTTDEMVQAWAGMDMQARFEMTCMFFPFDKLNRNAAVRLGMMLVSADCWQHFPPSYMEYFIKMHTKDRLSGTVKPAGSLLPDVEMLHELFAPSVESIESQYQEYMERLQTQRQAQKQAQKQASPIIYTDGTSVIPQTWCQIAVDKTT